ncbi:MAG: 3-methyl-2-oxobutanoate hydroxymethyltransferase, partial [Cyanobacteria bacterium REEB65]|nr:3-methyl-2-oxobutanoate hydroxymethyltransferase [Cyanobacteria bacterium REEB65]
MSAGSPSKRITAPDLRRMKERGERIVAVTAYDYATAAALDQSGVDVLLVGDSVAMVMLGHDTTLPVTMDEMLHHVRAVARGAKRALVVADLPFLSYNTPAEAVANGGRFLKEAGARAVKLEGGKPTQVEAIAQLVDQGIPVVAHLGFTPQSVHAFGGHRVQGKTPEAAEEIVAQAHALEGAGASALVL